ncbi:TPA: relaxase/mobilization nuclease domain-containing protein [Burkholderia cepacia ATCC 25416]|nr:relaxase/mobilization nuclease domain-containing protein [Burkholderia cepacia ATCC 25416]HDR9779067.1 relaxase/mobilization nuclease domain-containing protein [Burkholderia cepacia ATCC 25416]HDR9787197.1 relaxase/mobilization nuclease domain-containing protein [Burkholderia cepacia ATCC 25416]HDR9795541.1 relaxase/mobilization nuclease domain-containing protein [Burkholderia cepacia ATCC 25416]
MEYITNRDDDQEKLNDELDPSDRRRHHQILERAREHLAGAEDHLRAARRTDSIDADAVRVRLESARRAVAAYGAEHGRSDERVEDAARGRGGVDGDQHQRSLARARNHLRAAASYLRQAPQADRDFQERARARRANLAFNAESAQRRYGRDASDVVADLGRLLGEPERVVTPNGVACEHNCLSLATAAGEMNAVAAQNPRVKDPVYHIVLSWPSSESPTDEQAFDSGRYALAAVGMADHQYVFAVHRDTDNAHLHIAVNRVNPDTFAAVYPERDYFKLDRAMRELELQNGWQHDKGPYAVFERNGQVVIDWASKDPSTKGKRPTPAADMERHADQESLFTYARGEPRKALLAALKNDQLTWRQLHNLLAKYGLELREKGQGFAIFDLNSGDTTPIKASDMHEALGRARLVKRLGPFEPSESTTDSVLTYDKHRPLKRDPKVREERRQERAEARRELRARYDEYKSGFVYRRLDPTDVRARFAAIRADARQRRLEVRQTVTDPAARKALYSVIAFETLRARDRLQREIRNERKALRDDQSNRRQPYREWVERQAATGDAAAISQLRGFTYSEKRRAKELERALANDGADGIVHPDDADPTARDIAEGIYFRVRRDGTVVYRVDDGRDAFIDLGRRIDVLAKGAADNSAIAAALHLAAEKYGGTFELTGSEEFKRRAIDIMLEYKIDARLKDAAQDALRRSRAAELARASRDAKTRQQRRK